MNLRRTILWVMPFGVLALAGCAGTPVAGRPGFALPPVDSVIARAEPKPAIQRGDNLGTAVLKLNGALTRANSTITQGRTNYEAVRTQVSGQ